MGYAVGACRNPHDGDLSAEMCLRLLLDQAPVPLWTTDANLRLASFRGKDFAGREAEVRRRIGLTLYEFFRTDDSDYPPIAAHRQTLAGEAAEYEIAISEGIFTVRVEPLRDERGLIAGCVGTGLDITERKRMEATLRASEARYRAAFR